MKALATVVVLIIIGCLGAVVIFEWMAGCGETYIDSEGVRHANKCIYINR